MPFRILLCVLALPACAGSAHAQPPGVTGQDAGLQFLTGTVEVVWIDPPPGAEGPGRHQLRFDGDDGATRFLQVTPDQETAAGGLLQLSGARVELAGQARPGAGPPILRVEWLRTIEASAISRGATTLTGSQPFVWILLRFADDPGTPQPASWFNNHMEGGYPSLDHFWREVSYDNINTMGSQVVAWHNLPHPHSYYCYEFNDDEPGLDFDLERALHDAIETVDDHVDFPDFAGINLCFNDTLNCCSYGYPDTLFIDGVSKIYGVTQLATWGWQNMSVVHHESGHAFRLPHSSGQYGAIYDSRWDVMSMACGMCTDTIPGFGLVGVNTISYHKNLLGWIHPLHRYTMPSTPAVRTLWLNDLAVVPPANRYLMCEMTFPNDPSRSMTFERRRHTGYDVQLPGEPVIVHYVEPPYALVFDADGDGDPNDDGAMFEAGESFWTSSESAGVLMTVEDQDASGSLVTVTNAARRTVYVNLNNTGFQNGSATYPWNSVAEGSGSVFPGGDVWMAPGTYTESIKIRKAGVYQRLGSSGVVIIGE